MADLPVDYQDSQPPTGALTELPASTGRGINAITAAINGKQASDADLTTIAALSPTNDDVLQRKAGAWTNRTVAQLKADLGVAADIAAAQLVGINAQTVSYTLVIGDGDRIVEMTSASATNITVPPNSSVAFPIGTVIEVVQLGAGQVTVVAGSGVTLNTSATLMTRTQYSTLALRKRATNTWVVSGDAQ